MVAQRVGGSVGIPRARVAMPATVALALVIEEALALWRELAVAPVADSTTGPVFAGDAGQARAHRLASAAASCLEALCGPAPRAERTPPSRVFTPAPSTAELDPCGALTRRELDVLRLLAEGRTDREVAATLGVSHRTATTHVTGIFNKLGVATRTAAVALAIRAGLV